MFFLQIISEYYLQMQGITLTTFELKTKIHPRCTELKIFCVIASILVIIALDGHTIASNSK